MSGQDRKQRPPSPAERQAAAFELLAETQARLLDVLERVEDRLEKAERREHYEAVEISDAERAAIERPLRRVDWTAHVLRVPGMAQRFATRVPDGYLAFEPERTVSCPCGTATVVAERKFTACEGGCGRWFLGAEEQVYVAAKGVGDAAVRVPGVPERAVGDGGQGGSG